MIPGPPNTHTLTPAEAAYFAKPGRYGTPNFVPIWTDGNGLFLCFWETRLGILKKRGRLSASCMISGDGGMEFLLYGSSARRKYEFRLMAVAFKPLPVTRFPRWNDIEPEQIIEVLDTIRQAADKLKRMESVKVVLGNGKSTRPAPAIAQRGYSLTL